MLLQKPPLVRIGREEWKERADLAKGQRQQTHNKHRCAPTLTTLCLVCLSLVCAAFASCV
jgi:hypothetical protein